MSFYQFVFLPICLKYLSQITNIASNFYLPCPRLAFTVLLLIRKEPYTDAPTQCVHRCSYQFWANGSVVKERGRHDNERTELRLQDLGNIWFLALAPRKPAAASSTLRLAQGRTRHPQPLRTPLRWRSHQFSQFHPATPTLPHSSCSDTASPRSSTSRSSRFFSASHTTSSSVLVAASAAAKLAAAGPVLFQQEGRQRSLVSCLVSYLC